MGLGLAVAAVVARVAQALAVLEVFMVAAVHLATPLV